MKRSRIHLNAGIEGGDFLAHRTACGRPFVRAEIVTDDHAELTCKACLRIVASIPPPPPPEAPFESGPAYPVERQQWAQPGPAVVRRSVEGDDGAERVGWPTIDAALRDWWEVVGLSLLGSSSSFGGSGGARTDHTPGIVRKRVRILPVQRAVDAAIADGHGFDGDAGVGALRLPPGLCLEIVIRYMGGKSDATDIADRLMESIETEVTAKQVGLAWRAIRKSIDRDLFGRGLLDREAKSRHNVAKEGGEMRAPNGFDLESWKEIAGFVGLSVSTMQRLSRSSDPPPVHDYFGRVVARKGELASWQARQARARQGAA
jgi:hypothetical protein